MHMLLMHTCPTECVLETNTPQLLWTVQYSSPPLPLHKVCCATFRGADKAAQDVLGQKPLEMLIKKGKVLDEELLMMLS